jgi:hypothetical protein
VKIPKVEQMSNQPHKLLQQKHLLLHPLKLLPKNQKIISQKIPILISRK